MMPDPADPVSSTINELCAALEDILNYTGGAEGPLNDDYVVDRARAALDRAKRMKE